MFFDTITKTKRSSVGACRKQVCFHKVILVAEMIAGYDVKPNRPIAKKMHQFKLNS